MKAVSPSRRHPISAMGGAILILISLLAFAGCGSDDDDSSDAGNGGSGGGGGSIDLVAYSAPESVYQDVLEPAFLKTPDGSGVDFSSSFGASGDQSRAVEGGQPADVVHFAQGGDLERLVESGDVAAGLEQEQVQGLSPRTRWSSIVTREGNPEDIQSFDDLVEKDISVVTPNPISSGGARWNIMAIYNNALANGKSEDRGAGGREDGPLEGRGPAGQRV